MHFILARGTIAQFENLRKDYEAKRKVDLNAKPALLGAPVFLGGTDVVSRSKQVAFLEKVNAILKTYILKEDGPQQHQAYIVAARFMITACLYVQAQIGSKRKSFLYRLIDNFLGVSSENYLDEEDKDTCYLTAYRHINIPHALEHANATLEKEGLPPFTEKEWARFVDFLKEKSHPIEKKERTHFPFISLTRPLFGSAFSYVGATIGVVLAEGVSNSTSAVAPRVQLTALVGSTLLVFSPSGSTGVALLAPMIATKLLTSFCTISIAHILSTSAGYLGQGVGIGVGLPFDVFYNLLYSFCSVIARYYSKIPKLAALDGIRIADGVPIIAGIPIQLVAENALPQGVTKKIIELTDKGELLIEGEEVRDDVPVKIPDEILEELKKRLAEETQKIDKKDLEMEKESQALTPARVQEPDGTELSCLM